MRDILSDVARFRSEGVPVAIATVISTWGSAPRQAGAKMAIAADGRVAGSVSGGCVEGAVAEIAARVLKTGSAERARFGVADESAWAVGLACGGALEVAVEPLDEGAFALAQRALDQGQSLAVVTQFTPSLRRMVVVEGGGEGTTTGTLGDPALDRAARRAAEAALSTGHSAVAALEGTDGAEAFIDVLAPAPTLVMVGGVHIAVALDAIARALGYRTVVIDPRAAFGSAERFPHVGRLMMEWPDEALHALSLSTTTAVAVLTHDPKLDDPALGVALRSAAFYVGALGSRKTQEKRRARLLADGVSEEQLARLRAPIGLDLGGRSPEEIALAVMAQVVAVRNGKEPR